MPDVSVRIEKLISSLQQRIDYLSADRPTDTWKRQQLVKKHHKERDLCKRKIGILRILKEITEERNLTPFENALLTGTILNEFDVLYESKLFCERNQYHYISPKFSSRNPPIQMKLIQAGINDSKELQLALSLYEELALNASKPDDPREIQLRDMTYAARLMQKGDIQFTPESLARRMVSLANLNSGSMVLEPDAGIGNIADEVKKITPHVLCIEPVYEFRKVLDFKGYTLLGSDLFECPQDPIFDAVLMNPPFTEECRHIRYAYGFVKPGGVLVSVCAQRVEYLDTGEYREFREWLNMEDHELVKTSEKFEMYGGSALLLDIRK